MIRKTWVLALAVALVVPVTAWAVALGDMSDEEVIAWAEGVNAQLAADGWNVNIAEIEFYTRGQGRPPVRILQQTFRWVAGDARRLAQGDDMTFIVDDRNPGPSSLGFFPTSEVAIGMTDWFTESCMDHVTLDQRPAPKKQKDDITLFDFFFCGGTAGDPFAADIVHAGWFPAACFGQFTLAFSVTFIFGDTDADGNFIPSDINGDNYLDTALNEVYYNDAWGNPALPASDARRNFPWNVGQLDLPNIDIRTVSLHESGHSLGVGHFGPPPDAVMNPVYAGPRIEPLPIDHAGMCTVWAQWPNA